MLDDIDALNMVEKFGTVSEAAVRLRLTQSAVSKRIQALQQTLGFQLVEPDGRRVRLTARAISFLDQARPLVAELRGLTAPAHGGAASVFSMALADSIASSWGPAAVRTALQGRVDIRVELHVHRSVLVVESVRLGRYQIGLCTDPPIAKDLIRYPIIDEPLVLVHSEFAWTSNAGSPLIVIEAGSATWKNVETSIRRHHPRLLRRQMIPVESFPAAMQMVKAGFGDGVAPLGLVMEMGLDSRCYRRLSGVRRGIALVTRKTVHQLAAFQAFREQLGRAAAGYFSSNRGTSG